MKLTEAKLKKLILEMMEDEEEMTPEEKEKMIKSLGVLIKTGKWDSINQAIFLADTHIPIPWHLLPLNTMERQDLADLGEYLLDNTDISDPRVKILMRKGIKGLRKTDPNASLYTEYKKWTIGAIKKILGLSLRDRN